MNAGLPRNVIRRLRDGRLVSGDGLRVPVLPRDGRFGGSFCGSCIGFRYGVERMVCFCFTKAPKFPRRLIPLLVGNNRYHWGIVIPSQIAAATSLIKYWHPSPQVYVALRVSSCGIGNY